MFLSLSLAAVVLVGPLAAEAHGPKFAWEMSEAELKALEIRLAREREVLSRHFLNPTTGEIEITADRAMDAILALEEGSMRKQLFCRTGPDCGHNAKTLFQVLTITDSEIEADQKISRLRQKWNEIADRFYSVGRNLKHGLKSRWQNRQRYSQSLRGGLTYGSSAYGPLSVGIGAVTFGITFTAVEIGESLLMGPLHWVCQANWIWAVSFGLAAASLSRDAKAWLKRTSDKSWLTELGAIASGIRLSRSSNLRTQKNHSSAAASILKERSSRLSAHEQRYGFLSWLRKDDFFWPQSESERAQLELSETEKQVIHMRSGFAVMRALIRSELDLLVVGRQLHLLDAETKDQIRVLGRIDHDLRVAEIQMMKQLSLSLNPNTVDQFVWTQFTEALPHLLKTPLSQNTTSFDSCARAFSNR